MRSALPRVNSGKDNPTTLNARSASRSPRRRPSALFYFLASHSRIFLSSPSLPHLHPVLRTLWSFTASYYLSSLSPFYLFYPRTFPPLASSTTHVPRLSQTSPSASPSKDHRQPHFHLAVPHNYLTAINPPWAFTTLFSTPFRLHGSQPQAPLSTHTTPHASRQQPPANSASDQLGLCKQSY